MYEKKAKWKSNDIIQLLNKVFDNVNQIYNKGIEVNYDFFAADGSYFKTEYKYYPIFYRQKKNVKRNSRVKNKLSYLKRKNYEDREREWNDIITT
ncbi:hypothetical protein RIR_jg30298.t1 [Rhizophagus irregularis DAOM 181602=DAOM 197198]|nr:hypothetical protein RIR_jg30298.t1 [Rhizophagus irregularis DAOM 181602=DAOM 197198]